METGPLARGDDALSLPRLRASAHGARRRWAAIGPGVRLALVLVLALALTGGAAYMLISDELRNDQIEDFSRLQEADARGLEAVSANLGVPAAVAAVDKGLEAISEREGVSEALLIGPDSVVRASGGGKQVGSIDDDPSTVAILRGGPPHAGTEQDETEDESNFEFLVPLELGGARFVLETSYDSASFENQLSHIREILALLMLAAIPVVLFAFYLLGGRALLRGHRLALERATRDGLTDLPNHRAFQDEFEQAVSLAQRNGDPLALALIDLDNFKQVNDRRGHPEGDEILCRLAEILRNGRSADRPFRIGGDEFALMLQRTDAEGARMLSQRLVKTLSSAGIPVSVGVATLYPGESAKDLRSEADAALYEAKRAGGGRAALFADIRGPIAITTAAKRDAVNRLIDEGELRTVFQPIWALDAELLVGLEALSRPDPAYKLSGPEEAFDVAEQLGRVPELDRLCTATALGSAEAVLPPQALLFLNVAPKTLELGSETVEWIADQVEDAGLAAERVVIEVSERFPARTAPVADSLVALRKRGFQLALDDVGTGNSGLEMLRRIGADYVKLDRSIVAAASTEPNARGVLMAMATYARQTGAFVIAEGIEDEETLAFLRGIQASDFAPQTIIQGGQGFALGAPEQQPSLEISRRSVVRSPSAG